MNSLSEFIEELSKLHLYSVFNPYSDHCQLSDLPNAASLRRRNLERVLQAALDQGVDDIWIARDLGHRAGRRTGLPMTDDEHLDRHAHMYGLTGLHLATLGDAVKEQTTRIVWRSIAGTGKRIFLWNVFPLHPHLDGQPLSNRCHTSAERAAALPFLIWVVEHLKHKGVVAIGSDAYDALVGCGIDCSKVRHPSYGGQADFLRGIACL